MGNSTRRRHMAIPLAAILLLAAAACGVTCNTGSTQSHPVNIAPPTPDPAATPGGRVQTLDAAIRDATLFITGQPSTGVRAANIRAVSYVETTVDKARKAVDPVPGRELPYPQDTTAWLFIAQGDFGGINRFEPDQPLSRTAVWVLAVKGGFSLQGFVKTPIDLAQLGKQVSIAPGQVPAIDAVRAPLSANSNAMALDANVASPSTIDASRAITGSAQFSLGINVTADADHYKGYQWEIEYPAAGLAFDGSVVENSSATGLGVCTNAAANPNATPITTGDTVYGNGAGCLTASQTFQSSYVGQTTTFKMHCLTTGTFAVQLVDYAHDAGFGTTLIAADSSSLSTDTANISVSCQ